MSEPNDYMKDIATVANEYWKRLTSNTDQLLIYGFVMLGFITFLVLNHYLKILKRKDINAKNIDNFFSDLEENQICCQGLEQDGVVSMDDGNHNDFAQNYYIASSWNSCCGGSYNDDYVDVKPLEKILRKGIRFVDFEIYSINGQPIISAKSDGIKDESTHGWKGMYNHIDFNDAMHVVKNNMGNDKGPLFLNFRIKTDNVGIYNTMHDSIIQNFKHKLLDSSFQKSTDRHLLGNRLLNTKLDELNNKIVIICDADERAMENSGFKNLVNLTPNNTGVIAVKTRTEVRSTGSPSDNKEQGTKQFIVTHPDFTNVSSNNDFDVHWQYGFQMVAMNFGITDDKLISYLQRFNSNGSAFILKPEELRYKIITTTAPNEQTVNPMETIKTTLCDSDNMPPTVKQMMKCGE